MCPTLRLSQDFAHKMSVRCFEIINQHGTPHHAGCSALQPRHIIFHDVSVSMAVVMIVTKTHGNASPISINIIGFMLLQTLPTVMTDWHGAFAAEGAYIWFSFVFVPSSMCRNLSACYILRTTKQSARASQYRQHHCPARYMPFLLPRTST